MDGVCVVTINGVDYYCPADMVQYLVYDGSILFNASSSTITLYRNVRTYGDNSSGYPRISLQSMSKPVYYSSQNANYTQLQVDSFIVKSRSFSEMYILGVLVFFVLIFIWFKRS